ncbi:MAG TPA: hypothetical protein VFZ08_07765, partial [Terriglobia bacterium]|nr:hypothetical protein [Terriglobia bacterium]
QTNHATIGQVVGPKEMSQLPLNDRNYLKLALLSPGTSSYGQRSFYNSALTDNTGSINSGSGGEDRNSFSLDGADVKSYLINGSYVPSIDAIKEFKIETTPYNAALGTSPGAQILLVTKNGTNQFHGSVYDFLRNSALDAYNYFDNRSLPIPELRKNQFGGTLGGPIIKDKLFFFGDYEGFRERNGVTFFGTVPTVEMRNGDFSQIQQPIYNPLTTRPCSSCPSGVERDPFTGNIVPSGLISSVSSAFAESQFPLPTGPGIANNFAANSVSRTTRNQFNVRIDYSRPKDAIFGRFSFNNSTLYVAGATFNSAQLPGFGDNDVINSRSAILADNHTFNSTTLLEGQVTYFRHFFNLLPEQLGNDLNSKLGIQGVAPNEPFNSGIAGLSNPGSNPYNPEFRAVNQYGYKSQLTKVADRHTFMLGGEYDRWQVMINAAPSFPQGQFGFDGSFTKDPNAPPNAVTGIPFADFLLGYPVSALSQSGDSGGYMFRNNWRWWFNDEWRATRNLTLNLGIRWEYDGPFYEKFNRFSNFDPAAGALIIAGRDFVTRSANVRPDRNNYAPRFGFAYAIPGHRDTVLRGGYGIFYDIIQENNTEETRTNPPFSSFPQFFATNPVDSRPTIPLQNVFAPAGQSTPPAPIIEALDEQMQNGYQQQASFGIEHQFGSSIVAEVNYNWQKNTKFPASRNLDAPTQNGTFTLPYPDYSSIVYFTNLEYGNYNALLARVTKRFSQNLSFTTAFTWSKYLDNITTGDAAGAPGDPGFQNPYCFRCDYGPSASDFEKRFVQSWVYDFPSLAGSRPFVRAVAGGWELSGIFTYQSGFPVTPRVSFDNSQSLTFADRPDRLLGMPLYPAGTRDPSHWFNAGAFSVAPQGQFGNAGKGIILGPNLMDLDAALMKNFNVSERFTLQFRAEAFNITNHPNFADPSPFIDIPSTVGSITSTTTPARQIQLALKLTF